MQEKQREVLEKIFLAGLRAVDPEQAVRRYVQRIGNKLHVADRAYDLDAFTGVTLAGAGKGAAPMARALEDLLGDYLTAGCITVKYGHALSLRKTKVVEAGHPIPDEAGLEGTEVILQLAHGCSEKDLLICAFSGGGSALLVAPNNSISLAQKQATTRCLLESGATIDEINAVRKHLSRVKGGGLAKAAYPATVISLILSDVVDDRLDVIASGPTAPDFTTFQDCLTIVQKYGLSQRLPPEIPAVFKDGVDGRLMETAKAKDVVFSRVQNLIVGSNKAALIAAGGEARSAGYNTLILSSRIQGEAKEVAKVIVAVAKEVQQSAISISPPACVLAGGETTVTIRGDGKGGRNQELALAAAMALEGWNDISLLSAGTDGTDGPTDAAGAFADGSTCYRARKLGLDPLDHLARNDSYNLFDQTGDLLKTGPTRTNVMDLICVLIE